MESILKKFFLEPKIPKKEPLFFRMFNTKFFSRTQRDIRLYSISVVQMQFWVRFISCRMFSFSLDTERPETGDTSTFIWSVALKMCSRQAYHMSCIRGNCKLIIHLHAQRQRSKVEDSEWARDFSRPVTDKSVEQQGRLGFRLPCSSPGILGM